MVNFPLRCPNVLVLELIVGIKEWKLIPPEYADDLIDPRTETIPKSVDSENPQFSNLARAREKAIVVRQYPGETIFVPSGWYHQVTNLGSPPKKTFS